MKLWFPGAPQVARWWAQRTSRERVLVAMAAAALVLYAAVTVSVRPMLAARAKAREAIARYDADLARLATLPQGETAPVSATGRPVTSVLTETAPAYGLDIRLIEATGGGARVELADAAFADVLRWLNEMRSRDALRPVAVEMDQQATGIVAARLTFER